MPFDPGGLCLITEDDPLCAPFSPGDGTTGSTSSACVESHAYIDSAVKLVLAEVQEALSRERQRTEEALACERRERLGLFDKVLADNNCMLSALIGGLETNVLASIKEAMQGRPTLGPVAAVECKVGDLEARVALEEIRHCDAESKLAECLDRVGGLEREVHELALAAQHVLRVFDANGLDSPCGNSSISHTSAQENKLDVREQVAQAAVTHEVARRQLSARSPSARDLRQSGQRIKLEIEEFWRSVGKHCSPTGAAFTEMTSAVDVKEIEARGGVRYQGKARGVDRLPLAEVNG